MANVFLKKIAVSQIQNQLKKMQSETETAQKRVLSAISGLDFEVASKQNIKSSLNKLNTSLYKQISLSEQYNSTFLTVANTFVDSDGAFGSESQSIFDKVKDFIEDTSKSIKEFFTNNKMAKYATVAGLFMTCPSILCWTSTVLLLEKIADWIKTWNNDKDDVKPPETPPVNPPENDVNDDSGDEQENNTVPAGPLSEIYKFGDSTYSTLNLSGVEGFKCDQHYWQKITGDTGMCTATAWAIATNINRANSGNSNMVKPTDNWGSGGRQYTSPFTLEESGSSAARKLEVAYEELQKGNATWIRCTSKTGASGHDVVVVGLVEGADASNLSSSDFLIIDPADGQIKTLDAYKVKDGSASVCRYSE